VASESIAATRRRPKGSYIPPQHGAWAFLALPLALGAVVSPASPLLVVLALAWIAAYPLSYAALGLVRARRPQRFRRPFAVWLLVVLPAVAVLVVARPWLLWVGLIYLGLFAVNLRYAQRNDERALGNDVVFIVECAAMVPVTYAVAALGQTWAPPSPSDVPTDVWVLAVVCGLVLTGSILHVKSLIRERRNVRYANVSKTYALACLPLSVAIAALWGWPSGTWLIVPFVALAVRAWVVGRRHLRPGTLGIVELGVFLLVIACAALANLG
jgi:hypothetical protein